MRRGRVFLCTASLLVVAACAEQPWQSPSNPGNPATEQMRFAVQCTADVAARSVACDGPAAVQAMSAGRLVTGGQGSYVLLSSTGTTYDGSAVFQTNVSVQNRSAQPIGTTDGDYADGTRDEGGGIRVFFAAEPVVTGGTGTVTVTNPDSIMNITGPGQKAFIYEQMLENFQISALKNWQFNVPNTVTSFSFTVQISANIPHLEGILRYRQQGAGLNGISCSAATNCFAVGNHGTIRNRGSSWVWTGTGTVVDLHGVHTLSTSFAMAVGDGGTALRWNGVYWKTTGATGTAARLRGVWCASITDCFAVGDGSIVVRWNGATNTWSAATNGIVNALDLHAVWGSGANDIYAVGDNGNLIHWDGTTWSTIALGTTANFRGVWGSGVADIYVVGGKTSGGTEGEIWRGTGPSDVTWTQQNNPGPADLESVWGFGAANVFAVGTGGTTLRTVNNGTTWTASVSNATQTLEGVAGGGTNLYLVGAGGTIVTSTNSGTSFGTTTTGSGGNLNGVWSSSSSSNVYAVGDNGTIVHWDGTRLNLRTSGTTQHLRAVWGTGSTNIYAVGDGGTVLNSTNGGTIWTPVNLGTTANFRAIWGSAANNIYVVGEVGTVYQWNGAVWSPVVVPANKGPGPARNLNAVWGSAANNVYVVGDTGLIVWWNGALWQQQPYETGFPQHRDLHGIWGTAANDIWLVAKHGVILHNNAVIDTTITPPDTIITNGGLDTTIIAGDTVAYNGPWDHLGIDGGLDLLAVEGVGVGDVYAVSDSGFVLHQNRQLSGTGNGSSGFWSRMTSASPPGTKLRGVWATNATAVFIVGDNGLFIRGVR